MGHDGIDLDLAGENVRPETLDARASLGLAMALIEAVIAVGACEAPTEEAPFVVAMTDMRAGSVHLSFKPCAARDQGSDEDGLAAFRRAAKKLPVYLRGDERAPRELTKPLDRLRKAAQSMPANVTTNIRFLDETVALSVLALPEDQLVTSAEMLRAFIIRAGGKKPRVQLRVPTQKGTFTATISKEMVASDDFHVYREAEVAGVFKRDPRAVGSPIVSGEVTEVRFMDKIDRVAAFDQWNEANGRPWQNVQDIEEALRRRGPH